MMREVVDPLKHHDFFAVRRLVSLTELVNAKVHVGHKAGLRHPHMRPYIFGTRLGVDVIDAAQTEVLLGEALNFLAHVAYRGGVVLFVSRHRQMLAEVERMAQECGEYAHCRHWRGGMFTNATVQYGSVTRLPDVCVFLTTESYSFSQHVAITEAAKMNIPSIAILDTSCDPRLVTYPVPGNDDSVTALRLYCRVFKEAVLRGKAKYKELNGEDTVAKI
jgi:small subunit ribosomal protein S2